MEEPGGRGKDGPDAEWGGKSREAPPARVRAAGGTVTIRTAGHAPDTAVALDP